MDIAIVLNKIRPTSKWSMVDNDYKTLIWDDESKKPSLKEIKQYWEEHKAEIENEKIKNLRKAEYEKYTDPLFFKYQQGEASKQEWLNSIKEIKNKYPYSGISQQ